MIANILFYFTGQLVKLNGVIWKFMLFIQYSRAIAYLPKLHKPLQDIELRPVNSLFFYQSYYLVSVCIAVSVVYLSLLLLHFTEKYCLCLLWQVLSYLFLGPS